jgi:hypothetical protein
MITITMPRNRSIESILRGVGAGGESDIHGILPTADHERKLVAASVETHSPKRVVSKQIQNEKGEIVLGSKTETL